ncbi:hypothetical protein ACQKPE_20400 [Pseudomonas sp. NPDC089554]|uniref:hypothetical protein n=1 Tax=Pseudomonas sp. NPDC089554 TaxID=3390653 RepID=UPI003CFCC53A
MIRKAAWLAYAVSFMVLAGCGERDAGSCAAGGSEAFFKASIDAYYQRHAQQEASKSYTLVEGAHYDTTTNWWMVPFDAGSERLQALISCDGRLEITGR